MTRYARWPAKGERKSQRVAPQKFIASVEFQRNDDGSVFVFIELENRAGRATKFSFEGLDTQDVVSLDGGTKHVVFYELKFGAESVLVRLEDGSILVEEPVPDGGPFS